MPLSEVGEAVLKGIFRVFFEIIVEVVLRLVGYWIGWVFLRVLTLGRNPNSDSNEDFVSFVGIIVLCLTIWGAVLILG